MKKNNKKKFNSSLGLEMFIVIFSVISMILMAYNTSPFIDRIGEDSGIYLLIGKYLLKGRTLYIDFFDHKGPIIFFINCIPQIFFSGALGVWVIETICMSLSSILIFKISSKLLKNNFAQLISLAYILMSVFLMNGGNYSEEYANLFNIICIYIFINWRECTAKDVSKKQCILLGFSIAFNFFMKPNIALFSLCIWVYILIQLARLKKDSIIKYLLYSVVGICIVSVPIFIFCIIQNNLYEMFDAMIIHNIRYCLEGSKEGSTINNTNPTFQGVVLISIIISIVAIAKSFSSSKFRRGFFIIIIQVMTILNILVGGNGFNYYLLMEIPVLCLCSIVILEDIKTKKIFNKKIFVVGIFALSCTLLYIQAFVSINIIDIKYESADYKIKAKELGSNINADEKNDVFGYDAPAIWFLENDIEPPFKYFTMQEWMAKSDPVIRDKINEYVLNNNPKWIVLYKEDIKNQSLKNEIENNYTKISENKSGYLYRRNTSF